MYNQNDEHAGSYGGYCNCPNGQVYPVGDVAGMAGRELRCEGGFFRFCESKDCWEGQGGAGANIFNRHSVQCEFASFEPASVKLSGPVVTGGSYSTYDTVLCLIVT